MTTLDCNDREESRTDHLLWPGFSSLLFPLNFTKLQGRKRRKHRVEKREERKNGKKEKNKKRKGRRN
jgi:hypothetical protein